ncbi:hypothetical protein SGCOL_006773 [Colletotrichum sp. CLE4]
MSQSSLEIQAKNVASVDDVLQLAEHILAPTMGEVEQTLRPYIVAVLDCILEEIPKNIPTEQDNTTKGLDESAHTFSLEDTPEIVERFKNFILRFEMIDRLAKQPGYNAQAEQQRIEACVEAGHLKVLMGRVFDAIISDAHGQLPPQTSTQTVKLAISRDKIHRRGKNESRPMPRLARENADVGKGTVVSSVHSQGEGATIGGNTDASEVLEQKGANHLFFIKD